MWFIWYFHVNTVKYQYAGRAVCAYAHGFHKQLECAFIGACALIRTNIVCHIYARKDLTLVKVTQFCCSAEFSFLTKG